MAHLVTSINIIDIFLVFVLVLFGISTPCIPDLLLIYTSVWENR